MIKCLAIHLKSLEDVGFRSAWIGPKAAGYSSFVQSVESFGEGLWQAGVLALDYN